MHLRRQMKREAKRRMLASGDVVREALTEYFAKRKPKMKEAA
jgi:hypothetical protein